MSDIAAISLFAEPLILAIFRRRCISATGLAVSALFSCFLAATYCNHQHYYTRQVPDASTYQLLLLLSFQLDDKS